MTIIERWFKEVWNEGNEASIEELLHPEAIAHGITDANGNPAHNREAFVAYFRQMRAGLSDIHVHIDDVIHDGNRSVARCTVTARHTGEGFGILPANKPLHFTGMSWARIEDGQIVEGWNNFDFMTMLQQMQ